MLLSGLSGIGGVWGREERVSAQVVMREDKILLNSIIDSVKRAL